MLDVADLQRLAAIAEIDDVSRRPRRRDGRNLVERKLALGEDVEHLAPDIARRTHDDDTIAHSNISG